MNFLNRIFLATATAATAAVVSTSAPAQAFSLNTSNFGNDGISFSKNIKVNFTFLGSQGKFMSTLSVFEKVGNDLTLVGSLFAEDAPGYVMSRVGDWRGTVGGMLSGATASYTFEAGKVYTLGLSSVLGNKDKGTVYTTNALNNPVNQQAQFSYNGGATFWFDDRGSGNDADFNDFGVSAQAVPEPLTMGGLALAGAGLAYARRRRQHING